jgi:hypothetical protein
MDFDNTTLFQAFESPLNLVRLFGASLIWYFLQMNVYAILSKYSLDKTRVNKKNDMQSESNSPALGGMIDAGNLM